MKTGRRPLGSRSYGLLLCAFIWGLVGFSIIYGVTPHAPGTWHDELPTWLRVAAWLVPAAFAIVQCRMPKHDWLALTLLMLGPMVRTLSYLTSWALFLAGHDGYKDGWFAAALYSALIGLVVLIAGIRQVLVAPPHLDKDGDQRTYL